MTKCCWPSLPHHRRHHYHHHRHHHQQQTAYSWWKISSHHAVYSHAKTFTYTYTELTWIGLEFPGIARPSELHIGQMSWNSGEKANKLQCIDDEGGIHTVGKCHHWWRSSFCSKSSFLTAVPVTQAKTFKQHWKEKNQASYMISELYAFNIFCRLVTLQLMKKVCRLRSRHNRLCDGQRQDAGIERQSANSVRLV